MSAADAAPNENVLRVNFITVSSRSFSGQCCCSKPLFAPPQNKWLGPARDLDQTSAGLRMQGEHRMPRHFRLDNAALLHQHLRREQAALPVLEVDERQPALIGSRRCLAVAL